MTTFDSLAAKNARSAPRLYLVSPQSNSNSDYSRMSGSDATYTITRVASAAIATVAAMAPADFDVALCDEAIEPVAFDDAADAIGITAGVAQALRAIEIAREFHSRGKLVIMGGPHVSLAPELFEHHADCLVVGEFEPVAEVFFADLRAGTLKKRYAGGRADLSRSPMPRWDLYPNDRVVSGVVQTSRGCPFECHFCDVIQYLGRVQRHKDVSQVIAEIQVLYDLGYNFINLADDNLTVYRRRARSLLRAIADWNGAEGRDYVTFVTQMSIDVARDPELLQLCNDAGVINAFVGIETSDHAGLVESKKRQNILVDPLEACRTMARAGVRLEGGLIVGFDSDDCSAFRRQFDFAMTLPVPTFNLSVLVAPVATPLYESMQAQGRIITDDILAQFPSAHLISNFRPAQMTRDELFVGAKWLVNKLWDPDNFYMRLEAMSELLAPPRWVRLKNGVRYRHPSRRGPEAVFTQVMRDMARRDPRVAKLVRRCFALMKAKPEIRDAVGDALTHYLMSLLSYDRAGIYVRGWAELDAPPFGTENAAAHLAKITPRWQPSMDYSAAISASAGARSLLPGREEWLPS